MKKYFLLILILFFGCSNITGPKIEFSNALEKWKSFNFKNYSFSFQQLCFCPNAGKPFRIIVRNKIIQSVTDETTNEMISNTGDFKSIDALFQIVNDAIPNADKIEVNYNQLFGFPENVNIDYITNAADDEYGFTVTNFNY